MNLTEDRASFGVGTLALSAIPAALGGAALMWLAFTTTVIDQMKASRIEGRMEERVGIVQGKPLTAPVDLIIQDRSCVKIDRAFLDNGNVTMYLRNDCHHRTRYFEYRYKGVAPDGTAITSEWSNEGETSLDPGEKVEVELKANLDSRVVTIFASVTNVSLEGMY